MLTRCPACQTLFRVTPGQLRAQSGRVRCGQCQHAFNALDTLLEEPVTHIPHPPPVERLAQPVEHVPEPASRSTVDEVTGAPHATVSARTGAPRKSFWKPLWRTSTEPASRPEPEIKAAIDTAPGPTSPQTPQATEAAVLPAPTFAPAPESESATPAATPAPAASAPVIETTEPAIAPDIETETEPAAGSGTEPETESETEPLPESVAAHPASLFTLLPPPPRRWPWLAGSLLALLMLALQMALAFRVELATMMPDARPTLIALCDLAGCEVGLPAKAELIGIEASDLHPDPQHAERLEVSATLKNRAPFAQTWPHLELTLTDTADKAIARKVLAPAEYLPAPTGKTILAAGMPANGEVAVSFIIAIDGLAASGYRLYLFYP